MMPSPFSPYLELLYPKYLAFTSIYRFLSIVEGSPPYVFVRISLSPAASLES